MKPTFYEFRLNTGEKVEVTRNYAALYALRAKDKSIYEMSQILNHKGKGEAMDDIETAQLIYASYVAAAVVNKTEYMQMEDFLAKFPFGNSVADIIGKLYGTEKKRTSSRQPLNEEPED